MKSWAIGLGLSGVLCAAFSSFSPTRPTTVIVTGDILGYLSPCGCTYPMIGGIKRQATLIRRLSRTSNVVLLANGALTGGTSKQEQMKVETLAATFGSLNAAAINLAPEDAKLGQGTLQAIQNLSNQKLICGSIEEIEGLPLRPSAPAERMLIGGVSSHPSNLARPLGTRAISGDAPISSLIRDAKEEELVPVLLLDGTQNDAESTARKFPDLKLIVYRSSSESPLRPLRVGQTLLVTPGQFGKKVVSLSFDGKAFSDYQVVALGPDLVDDRDVSKLYKSYLHRVDQAGFLDRIVRKPSGAFAGTTACGQCHISSLRAWKNSTHALALANLEAQGHGRDPDCVTCHVVGLNLQGGYRSRLKTPDMANVGCESCHGSGARHSQKPLSIKMSKVGTVMCAKCHNPDQSPGFNPITFWGRIKHR